MVVQKKGVWLTIFDILAFSYSLNFQVVLILQDEMGSWHEIPLQGWLAEACPSEAYHHIFGGGSADAQSIHLVPCSASYEPVGDLLAGVNHWLPAFRIQHDFNEQEWEALEEQKAIEDVHALTRTLSSEPDDAVVKAELELLETEQQSWRALRRNIRAFNYEARQVPADGDCGVHSLLALLSHQGIGGWDNVMEVRQAISASLKSMAGNEAWHAVFRALIPVPPSSAGVRPSATKSSGEVETPNPKP